jgi:hypothetical protein
MRRGIRDDESGQALVLGAVALIVLALAVMTSAQIGRAVHTRIAVQNAADGGAYSLAVAVARSFNFMAWTNRVMIAHYVAMMALASIASTATVLQAAIAIAADVLQTAAGLSCAAGVVLIGVEQAARALRQRALGPLDAFLERVDRLTSAKILELARLNLSQVHEAQRAMKARITSALDAFARAEGLWAPLVEESVGAANEANPTGRAYQLAMAHLNRTQFLGAFDADGSERIPIGGTWYGGRRPDGVKAAERLMAELANGTRAGRGKSTSETRRELDRSRVLGVAGGKPSFSHAGSTRLVDPMDERQFTERDSVGRNARNHVFMSYWKHTLFSRGSALVAAEHLHFADADGRADPIVGIQAAARATDSFHCRYAGFEEVGQPQCPSLARTRPMRCDREGFRHRWLGITPYVSFEPSEDSARLFNQPDLIALVNVAPERARIPASFLRSRVKQEGAAVDSASGAGFNGWARAQVYYHRPGFWAEPPNFFNPFWRAKLAPLLPALGPVVAKAPGLAPVARSMSSAGLIP